MFVIIIGNLASGVQTIHGPFEDCEHAHDWISRFAKPSQPCVILPLLDPNKN